MNTRQLSLAVVTTLSLVNAAVALDPVVPIVVRLNGEFGQFNPSISNLPENTYPFPELLNGGYFRGIVSYDGNAEKHLIGRFPFLSVHVSVFDRENNLVHTIDTGPNGLLVSNNSVSFNLGESSGPAAVFNPEDLRIRFSGQFSATAPKPPAAFQLRESTFHPFYSFIEVDGEVDFTFWDVDVVSATLVVVPEPTTYTLALAALCLATGRQRK